MLTYAEQERFAFINGDPSRELLAECADMEKEIDTHPDQLKEQFKAGERSGHKTACKLLQSMQQSITQFLEK